MRSLTVKLIAAFVVIGLVSILSIVLLARWNTRNEFDRFVLDKRSEELTDLLGQYYEEHGSWAGIPQNLIGMGDPDRPPAGSEQAPHPPFMILDADGRAIREGAGFRAGEVVPEQNILASVPIEASGEQVGTLVQMRAPFPNTPRETEFITRTYRLFWLSAMGASLMALLLGILVSRGLTRPLRELTNAAHAISEGKLVQQVPVRSRDEMGELAQAFNRMSSELARSINVRRQMTADIAHELRTPLSLILGHAEAVHDGVLPASKENFEIIREEAGRLEHLIEDLRTLSLADAGELSICREKVAPERLLQEAVSLYQYQARNKQVSLDLQVMGPLPELELDPGRMTQVLTNILDNALQHTPAGGSIQVTARLTAAGVELSIHDSGPGLATEDLERVFDRFYRVDASRTRGDGGSGLGLAIARSIVQAHGGQIRAQGQLGEGLEVTITIPEISDPADLADRADKRGFLNGFVAD